jgi:hypothetical protein
MYLLYVDESGDPQNRDEKHFVLGGLGVFERQTHWLSQNLDSLEVELFGDPESTSDADFERPVEFHASTILARRRPPWDTFEPEQASQVIQRLCDIVAEAHPSTRLFSVVHDRTSFPEEDPVVFGFSELTNRFDLFLKRLHAEGDTQRGLMIFDESRHEKRLQTLLRTYSKDGGPFGRVVNFSDVPLFADSKASRILQLADFIAWAVFRRYERGDTRFFDRLVQRFDCEGPRIHGLFHRTREHYGCFCAACLSRRVSSGEA